MARFQTLIVFEAFLLGILLALPVYWIRRTHLGKRQDAGIYWRLLLAALLTAVGAIAGLRLFQEGFHESNVDPTSVWFLPLVATFYLHVRITHDFKQTAEITLFLILIAIPVAYARQQIGLFLFSMPE